jgi:heterodisulfide reductase subunit C
MDKFVLSKENFNRFIKKLTTDFTVYAPVENNTINQFDKITDPSEINLNFSNTKVPPKSLLFKQTETLFKFKPGISGNITSTHENNGKSVIFGIRPCDARSFEILDHAFNGEFEDPYYLSKRKNIHLVGLSCIKPCANCFCTSFDDGPTSSKSMDLLLTDIGDKYFLEVPSEKGKQLIKNMDSILIPAKKDDEKKKDTVTIQAIKAISRSQNTEGIVEKLDKIFENPLWKDITDRCLGCGTCTYLCPTCHCFDIQDESTLSEGARIRIWDACMIPEYTLQASGYNPRPMRANRMRNRIMHKYNYYPKNFDVIACVGCGRCIDNCPVNIDIIDTVSRAREAKL